MIPTKAAIQHKDKQNDISKTNPVNYPDKCFPAIQSGIQGEPYNA